MNSFAHPISMPRARSDAAAAPSFMGVLVIALVAVLAVAVISGAWTYRSMNAQLESAQNAQVAAQEQSAMSSAMLACVQNHGSGATDRCRAAATTFAFSDSGTNTAAYDRAVHFIYPNLK